VVGRLINKLAEKHKDWIHMAKSFGCDDDAANELVQGMYLRLSKYVDKVDKIMYDKNNINTYYVYVTLRNLFLSGYHKVKKDLPIENINVGSVEDVPFEYETAFDKLISKIEKIVGKWYWYDKKLWEIHFKQEKSMRKIASLTKISLSSIFNTLKNGKEKIRSEVEQEWQNYLKTKKDK